MILRRPLSTTLFIYALAVSLLAFVVRDLREMLLPGFLNMLIGFIPGFRKFRLIILLFFLGMIGLSLNSLLVANTGRIIIDLSPLIVIRENALNAIASISLRLGMISGATLFFLSLADPRSVIKDLERDLRLPKGIVFSVFYALRLYQLMKKDLDEISLSRVERGFRRTPILPGDTLSLIIPLLSVGIERALWAGISAEVRGLSLRKPRYKSAKPTYTDYMIYLILLLQIAYIIMQAYPHT